MAMITCPECAKQVSDVSSACIGCGYPLSALVTASTAKPLDRAAYDRRSSNGLRTCENCGADAYRKLSVIHAGGLSVTQNTSVGVGLTLGGSIGLGKAKTAGTSQTVLSAKAAPPKERRLSAWALLGILLGLGWTAGGADYVALGVLTLAGTGYYIFRTVKYNKDEFPKLYARWDRSYMCERCGTVSEL